MVRLASKRKLYLWGEIVLDVALWVNASIIEEIDRFVLKALVTNSQKACSVVVDHFPHQLSF
jgi:hypothetical protein